MPANKITLKPEGSAPSAATSFLVTQPEFISEGDVEKTEALRRISAAEMAAFLKILGSYADAGQFASLDENVHDKLALVDYGYNQPYSQEENPSSDVWKRKIGIDRNGTIVMLNKARSIEYDVRIRVTGEVDLAASQNAVDEWSSGISLKAGHEYAVTTKLLSGTSDYDLENTNYPPACTVYETGTHVSIGTVTREEGCATRNFTAQDNKQYNISLYINSGKYTFTNAKLLVTLEDLTNSRIYRTEDSLRTLARSVNAATELIKKAGARVDISQEFVFTDGYRVNYQSGALNTEQQSEASDFVDIKLYDKIRLTCKFMNVNYATGLAFYAEKNASSYISGVKCHYDTELEAGTYEIRDIKIPEGAGYIRTSWWSNSRDEYQEVPFFCTGIITGNSGEDLPDYYFEDSYIDSRVDHIQSNRAAMGSRFAEMMFFTDPHFYARSLDAVENGMNQAALIKYVMNRTNIRHVVCGGDMVNGKFMTVDECMELYKSVRNHLSSIWDYTRMVIGNHEWNNENGDSDQDVNMPSFAQIFGLFVGDKISDIGGYEDECGSYYIDETVNNIRYFYIGCNKKGNIDRGQLIWFKNTVAATPDGYSIIVFSHIALTSDSTYIGRFDQIIGILDKAKAKGKYEYLWPETTVKIEQDYSNVNVDICCVIAGHNHLDLHLVSTAGIPVITTTCDRGPRSRPKSSAAFREARAYGTINEQAIDVIQIDITNRKIYMTRLGGSFDGTSALQNPDREFDF